MVRNDMKHNINKIQKGKENIEAQQKKRQNLIDENLKNEKELPIKEQ